MHNHGPRKNPCPGSHKPPLGQPVPLASQPIAVGPLPSVAGAIGQSSAIPAVDAASMFSPADWGLIKHIPKSARTSCAKHLAGLLRDVVAKPRDVPGWIALLHWGGAILSVPKRGGKKHNLTSCIRKRLSEYAPTDCQKPETVNVTRKTADSPSQLLAQAVTAKLEDGNLKAAIRLLVSDSTPVLPSRDGLAKLQLKHPPATLSPGTLPPPQPDCYLQVVESDVRKALISFPAGSSGGPDGVRPQHLKDLVNCQEAGADMLSALTVFVNMVLAGHCPKEVTPVFFGGRLIALDKKSGGIRPIAIGMTLRRLVSKCANAVGVARLASLFTPRQLGVGISGGCEAAVHSARRFLQSLPADHVMVKLDFSNAFNSLHRHDMLLATRDRLPELYGYCLSAYSEPSILFYGQYSVMSNEGPQQGDPIGPLLFCNTVHPLLESLESDLLIGYLDDLTLGGAQSVVARDVERVIESGHSMGLDLNVGKCELIVQPGTQVTHPLLQSFQRVDVVDASLLGAPLFTGQTLDRFWAERCADLARAVERLKLVASQDALILLRASFSAPRVQHLLRCSPSVSHEALATFDELLRSALCHITNSVLSDNQWLQATLPVRDGGLGVRRVASLALHAYLASAASTLPLQDAILSSCTGTSDPISESYRAEWCASFGAAPVEHAGKQSTWDRPGVQSVKTQLQADLVEPCHKAAFLAAAAPHSGDWLAALPITACGLRLDDEAIRVAVDLRLGLALCVPHPCNCGAQVDARGVHAMVCKRAPGRVMRHQALNDIIARAFASAGVPVTKEPTGLSRSDGKRPDGLTLIPWQAGKPLTWDVTVASTLATSYVRSSAGAAGAAAELAATRKCAKYMDLPTAYSFQPIAFETHGPINSSAVCFLSDLGRKIRSVSGEEQETRFLFQRLSVNIQRFNAILLHDSFVPSSEEPDQ